MNGGSPSSLIDTLTVALSQCREQLDTIHQQALRIEQLRTENERLRDELANARSVDTAHDRESLVMSKEVQDLFQRNINTQAENRQLRNRLKAYKEKASERLGTTMSSPVTSSPTSAVQAISAPLNTKHGHPDNFNVPHCGTDASLLLSPVRKKRKLVSKDFRYPLSEQSVNLASLKGILSARPSHKIANTGTSTAEWLAEENGENQGIAPNASELREKEPRQPDEARGRLNVLLTRSRLTKSPLSRRRSRSLSTGPDEVDSVSFVPLPISNIDHASVTEKPDPTGSTLSRIAPQHLHPEEDKSPNNISGKAEASAKATKPQKLSKKSQTYKPLRKRPLGELSLHHFKQKPGAFGDRSLSYGNVVNDGYADRIRALAATLPNLPGQNTHEAPISDHDMLLEYLGSGAESRIAELSPSAKRELLFKATEERVARAFASRMIDKTSEGDAPGFWSAEMPGTQEDLRNKTIARERERAEVEKRYRDAVSNGVDWIFADE